MATTATVREPHYHLIIVGLPANERTMVYDCWNKGRIDIEPVGNGAIRYTLSYIDKQVFGAQALYESYGDFQPPFCLFSKGIGTSWIEKHIDEFNQYGEIKYPSGKSFTLNPYYRRKYDFDNKPYESPFSDSVIKYAQNKHLDLITAYQERCRLKTQEAERKMVHKREPLYVASKAIIKKDFDSLRNKKEIDIIDCCNFTEKYLHRDDELIFDRNTLNHLGIK